MVIIKPFLLGIPLWLEILRTFNPSTDPVRLKNERKFLKELQLLLKDPELLDAANLYLDSLVEEIRNGRSEKSLKNSIERGPLTFEGAFEVAKARIAVSEKFSMSNRLWLDYYSASYSTPEVVGKYRASRLEGCEIFDIGCGAGMQSIFFAENNDVTGVEISPLRVAMAKLNASVYGHKLRRIINADYASVIDNLEINSETVVFSDPLRPSTEVARTLESLVPSPIVLRNLLSPKTEKYVFDLPPQMRWENISLSGEKEYISIEGSINRLTLYQGKLAKSEASAVILPKGGKLSGELGGDSFLLTDEPEEMIYMPDPALIYSGLLHKLQRMGSFKLLSKDKRRVLLTADSNGAAYFPGDVFHYLEFSNEDKLTETLQKLDCGKVVLRFHLPPEEYYKIKGDIEAQLSGSKELYIFKHHSRFLICEKDSDNIRKSLDGVVVTAIK